MDHRKTLFGAAIGMALLMTGCGWGGGTSGDGRDPQAVMTDFLNAVRGGDDKQAAAMLTTLARQKTTEMQMVVAPPGSDTANFKVLEVETEGDEAQVGTDWTDLDADGQPRTDRVVWLLRKEADGWRIHGMGTRVFDDLPPIILNFEDPADMLRKQQQAEEEIARRDAQTGTGQRPATKADESKVR